MHTAGTANVLVLQLRNLHEFMRANSVARYAWMHLSWGLGEMRPGTVPWMRKRNASAVSELIQALGVTYEDGCMSVPCIGNSFMRSGELYEVATLAGVGKRSC